MSSTPSANERDAAALVLENRWAALATIVDGAPLASMVAYAPEPGLASLVMHLCGLAAHTGALLREPRASLVISAPDPGAGDPQTIPRITLQGHAFPVERDAAEFEGAWRVYVERFPDAAPRLDLGDFVLFRFVPGEARFVGGFARAVTLDADRLRGAARARSAS